MTTRRRTWAVVALVALAVSITVLPHPGQAAAAEAAAAPTLTVQPGTDLVDGQVVEVIGEGFDPAEVPNFMQCHPQPAGIEDCISISFEMSIDPEGFVSQPSAVVAKLTAGGRTTDCRTTTLPCVIVATDRETIDPRISPVALHFDPASPLKPGPQIAVDPSTDIVDGEPIEVQGTGFTPDGQVSIQVCEAGTGVGDGCDSQTMDFVVPGADGGFRIDVALDGEYSPFRGDGVELVDCRVAPGCELVAVDLIRREDARVPVSFAPLPTARPWLDPTFDQVEVTRDVLYRTTTDVDGNAVELRLDIWQPAGDVSTSRPVMLWMHGGYFVFGDRRSMDGYARDFARRGYVAVSVQYRLRPNMEIDDGAGIVQASFDAYEDVLAAIEWLTERADEYRIDPDRIAAGGYSAGANTSLNLAYAPGQVGPPTSPIKAAVSIAGLGFAQPDPGEPPMLAFHGSDDTVSSYPAQEHFCGNVVAAGPGCELVTYTDAGHDIVDRERHDIVRRTAQFLYGTLIEPPVVPTDPAPPTPPTAPDGSKPTTPDGSTRPGVAPEAAPLPGHANFVG